MILPSEHAKTSYHFNFGQHLVVRASVKVTSRFNNLPLRDRSFPILSFQGLVHKIKYPFEESSNCKHPLNLFYNFHHYLS